MIAYRPESVRAIEAGDMSEAYIRVGEREGIAQVLLANPARCNPLTLATIRELTGALITIGESDARAVVLGAEGPVFCAGHDFRELDERDLEGTRELLAASERLMLTLHHIPIPVMARVQGPAIGAGCQLALSCDLAIAAEDATFQTPGGKGGWFCVTPMVALTRAIGRKRAMEMLLTGDPVDAPTAERWGMINRAVPPGRLNDEADDLIRRAARGSRAVKAIGKKAFYAQIELDERAAYDYATEVMAMTSQMPDARERIRAFIEKRASAYDSRPD